MHHFDYRENEMYCEDVPIRRIAEAVGTPFYLYSHATLTRHFRAFDQAFEGIDRLICFSAKANTSQAILTLIAQLGGGLDIVSGGELFRGLEAGMPPEKIVYSGVGKRVDEVDYALNTGILMFNIESPQELELINQRAGALGQRASIAIRVNPDVDPKTHPYISTGLKKNKFGINTEAAFEAYQHARKLEYVDIVGVDCHIGSQIAEAQPFEDALERLMALIARLKESGISIQYLDMGGGLGIRYADESPPHPEEYARALVKQLKDHTLKLILEPGRVIVGNAGVLVAQVLYRKSTGEKEFVITDAAMNDLLRPSLYNAYHEIRPVTQTQRSTITADVVGPVCESSDFLATDRQLGDLARQDLIAVMSAGAYGFTMASNYCSRLRVAEVMVQGEQFEVIRERERYPDLIRGEHVPGFMGN